MYEAIRSFLFSILSVTFFSCLIPAAARGQVIPDDTTTTTVNQNNNNFVIEQGDRSYQNSQSNINTCQNKH